MGKMVDESMPRELAEIVKFHSAAAAAAALASGWIPGAGALAAVTISAGFVWSMYARIGAKIGLPFSHNVLKSLASGVATNLAANVVGALALSTIISFVPGLGSVGASVIAGATCYALTLGSGYIYLKVMTMLFAKGVCPSSLSEKELQAMAASVAKDSDVRAVMKEAKSDFRKNKGEL
jgi:uncharacterized protein (DUF697 family)